MGTAIRFGAVRQRGAKRCFVTFRPVVTLWLALCSIVLLAVVAGCAPAPGASTTLGTSNGSINHLHDVAPLRELVMEVRRSSRRIWGCIAPPITVRPGVRLPGATAR